MEATRCCRLRAEGWPLARPVGRGAQRNPTQSGSAVLILSRTESSYCRAMKGQELFRWIASLIGALLVVPFLQAPAAKLAERIGWDSVLANRAESISSLFDSLTGTVWLLPSACFSVGIVLTLWVQHYLHARSDPETKNEKGLHIKDNATLTVIFRKGQDPLEIKSENIGRWYVAYYGVTTEPGGGVSVAGAFFFIVFDTPIFNNYKRLYSTNPEVRINIMDYSSRGVVVQIAGPVVESSLEMAFGASPI